MLALRRCRTIGIFAALEGRRSAQRGRPAPTRLLRHDQRERHQQSSPCSRRRRPARRPRGAAPAAQGRGLRASRPRPRRPASLAALEAREFDVVLIDLNYARDTTSGEEGLDLLSQLAGARPDAAGRRDDGVGQRRSRGRSDAPRRARLRRRSRGTTRGCSPIVRTQIELGRALRRAQRLEAREPAAARATACPQLIAESPAMQPVLAADRARRAVGRQRPDHRRERHRQGRRRAGAARRRRARAGRPLVTVNAGGALRGRVRERAVRPRARARSPTPRPTASAASSWPTAARCSSTRSPTCRSASRPKLLRVLETGEFERVGSSRTRRSTSASSRRPTPTSPRKSAAGRFRQDLLFRLNTIEIRLPPLRERREDIPLLAQHFLRQHAQRYRKHAHRLRAAARCRRCSSTRGRATSASSITPSSAPC